MLLLPKSISDIGFVIFSLFLFSFFLLRFSSFIFLVSPSCFITKKTHLYIRNMERFASMHTWLTRSIFCPKKIFCKNPTCILLTTNGIPNLDQMKILLPQVKSPRVIFYLQRLYFIVLLESWPCCTTSLHLLILIKTSWRESERTFFQTLREKF